MIDETPPKKVVAFIYSQKDRGNPIHERVVRIQDVEEKERLNFQAVLPESEKKIFEEPPNIEEWF